MNLPDIELNGVKKNLADFSDDVKAVFDLLQVAQSELYAKRIEAEKAALWFEHVSKLFHDAARNELQDAAEVTEVKEE